MTLEAGEEVLRHDMEPADGEGDLLVRETFSPVFLAEHLENADSDGLGWMGR